MFGTNSILSGEEPAVRHILAPSSAKSYSRWAVLLLFVELAKRECLWIVWCRLLVWEARSLRRTTRTWNFLLTLLVVYIDSTTFVSGRRKTAACPLSYKFFVGCDEGGCALGWCSSIRDNSLSCFASSHCPTIGKLGVLLHSAALTLAATLELLRDHRADCCGPEQLGCLLQTLKATVGGSHLE